MGGLFLTANQKSYPWKKTLVKNIIAKGGFVVYFVLPQEMLKFPAKFCCVFKVYFCIYVVLPPATTGGKK